MDRFLHFNLSAWRCKKPTIYLACAWLFGLVTGVLFSMSASDVLRPTMRAALDSCVSIPGLLSAMLLPLLFSALAVFISSPHLLMTVVFFKAFVFAFLGCGILVSFGSAGWLVRLLLMFGDIALLPVLWWYWLGVLTSHPNAPQRLTAAVIFALLIGSLDYCVISPFWANLISY